MALYGKYRPKNFTDLVGQEYPKITLQHAAQGDRISQAYLFCGSRGTGKTSTARILAKTINCQNITLDGNPCGECEFCVAAEEGKMMDLIEIDAASNRGIDEMRDLREKISFAPNQGRAKIYIIDEVHMLTKEAFNALLKTLEEPPSHAYFILATTEFHKVPETIRSRCQTFFFRKITMEDIVSRLEFVSDKEGFKYQRLGIEMIAERAAGGLRDALSLLEQSASFGDITAENLQKTLGIISDDVFVSFYNGLSEKDSNKSLLILDEIQNEGRSLEEFGKGFLEFLRKQFHRALEKKLSSLPWILEMIEVFEEAIGAIKTSEIPPLPLEVAIAKSLLLQSDFVNALSNDNFSASESISTKQEPAVLDTTVSEGFKDDLPFEPDNAVSSPSAQIEEKNVSQAVNTEEKKTPHVPPVLTDHFEENVRNNWDRLINSLPSSLKMMVKTAEIVKVVEGEITISILSEMFRKKVSDQSNKKKIEESFSEILEHTVCINVQAEDAPTLDFNDVENILNA